MEIAHVRWNSARLGFIPIGDRNLNNKSTCLLCDGQRTQGIRAVRHTEVDVNHPDLAVGRSDVTPNQYEAQRQEHAGSRYHVCVTFRASDRRWRRADKSTLDL